MKLPVRQKECRDGTFLYLPNDMYIGRSLELYGEFSHGEMDLFAQILKPGMIVFDVGANIGAHTIGMAKLVGPEGAVAAFEPQRFVFQMLCANAAINGLPNVHAYNLALGDKNGTITVPGIDYSTVGNFGGLPLGSHKEGYPVGLRCLDDMGVPRCNFIKMDIEGMELEAIRGADDLIKRCRPIIYWENNPSEKEDEKEKSRMAVQHMMGLNYRLYWHLPPMYSPDNFSGNKENVFGDVRSFNILSIPREYNINVDLMNEITSLDQAQCPMVHFLKPETSP